MKKALLFAIPLVAVLGAPAESQASDHIDGLKTALDMAADLTDLFTFTSPQNPDKLVLIMNVHPLASRVSRFSDSVDYMFRIRPIDDAKTLTPTADPRREQSIVCSFKGGLPLIDAKQQATCKFNLGTSTDTVNFDTRTPSFTAGGSGEQNGIRIFAGVRSDPWFLDNLKTVMFVKGDHVQNSPGVNGLAGHNVLSIVVELDKRKLGGPLLAITAQSVRK